MAFGCPFQIALTEDFWLGLPTDGFWLC